MRVWAAGRHLMMLGAAIFVAGMAVAAQVRPVNLEEMTLRADRIFAGRCIGVEVVHEATSSGAGDIAQVTFRVDRAVKGSLGEDVVLKVTSGDDGRGGGTSGVPSFRPGDEVVLFLYGESALGLSSPVGLGQGRFRIIKDKEGRRFAVNDFANRGLLRGLTPAAMQLLGGAFAAGGESAPLDPTVLLDMAQTLTTLDPKAGS